MKTPVEQGKKIGILENRGWVDFYVNDKPTLAMPVGPMTIALQKELAKINRDTCPCAHGQKFDNRSGRWEIER